mgnify:CR=1 FL=1
MNKDKDFLGTEPVGKLMFRLALPTITAQLINMLYNIIDRIYIGHIPGNGALALTGVGVCMPLIMIISAFAALVGGGGAPHASIAMGKNDLNTAEHILGNCFFLQILISIILTVILLFGNRTFLLAFGASENTIEYAVNYMNIYAVGTIFVQLTLGMNMFITTQGFAKTGMLSVLIGAVMNIVLDPLFIFAFHLGVRGAALATILSQAVSCIWVLSFLCGKKTILHIRKKNLILKPEIILPCVALGLATFIMQASESIISVCFNSSLLKYGGDIAVGAMTILTSVMQFAMLPLQGLGQGAQPVLSYNYGARRPSRVKNSGIVMALMVFGYTAIMWSLIILAPGMLIRIFSSDSVLVADAIPALKQYFAAFIFMDLQYIGQTVFKSLNKKKQAIFFSLLRKVVIVVPLTYLFPYVFHMGTHGVFLAEPVSNVIGGGLCFVTMLATILPELKRMENQPTRN